MPMVPLSWLSDHVEVAPGTTAKDLAAALVRVGLEEETIHPARVTGPLVVGRVLTRHEEPQHNGKVINYCRVDVGAHNDAPGTGKEPSDLPSRGIICGAHNFEVGDLVVVSLPGAVLPGPFPIAARKTYGHVSDGMMCSARELGLGDDHSGIVVLTRAYPGREIPAPGADLVSFLGLGEEVLEINVTPDRGYCFSIRGVAREYSHSTGAAFTDPGLASALPEPVPAATADGFPVEVADAAPIRAHAGCDRFVTRIVRGVDPSAPTPEWMRDRLEMAGMRSISLPVDVTNYVMLDLGQPMHAYDLATLSAPIMVRRAADGERLETLDGVDRALDPEDLLITDSPDGRGSRIIGMAGVMGGAATEVSPSTTDILLEAAHFDAVSVARTARRHRLPSEASKRFERGTDPLLPPVACQRAVDLLVEYGGGQADPAVSDWDTVRAHPPVRMRVGEPRRLTGVDYGPARVRELLQMVGCTVAGEDADAEWLVTAPSWRPDLVGPADLVEEVARLDGYGNIPSLLPAAPAGRGLTGAQRARRQVSDTLAQGGLVEVESYPFVSDSHDRQRLPEGDARRRALRLRNPLAEDAPLLRTSILDTLLDTAGRNASRGALSIAVFETGMVAHPDGTRPSGLPSAERRPSEEVLDGLRAGVPAQPWHIGAVLAGAATAPGVLAAPRPFDWSDAVEAVRRAATVLGVRVEVTRAWEPDAEARTGRGAPPMPVAATDPSEVAPWHPGRAARVFARRGRDLVGLAMAGELHPEVCRAFGLPARSCAFELNLDALIAQMPQQPVQVKPVSTYPLAKEDIALVVDRGVPAARVEQVVRQAAGPLAEDVTLFDIYEGDQVPEGHRSLAFALRLRAPDHTLTAEESAQVRHAVVKRARKLLGAELRS
ncbi:MAG: phenylalanine--tRNA ligase subunit beta [Actinomyces sp.]|jgi:phenylalanyl-tRNA synthetase beta chain|nr:phenylalanine--tRNA ligase subunit beta [Actinomyces sp.]MCI1642538.1 phenylalanine--tRNA ligase subunit beta [Actinomyces sp.]MCI1663132.1 phenylalanine--tRNA ligase subunit beta [Actinomyces sp.]MCI1691286.1 phenylalanine--tRNA ligase subunit beta [Actinomyces sp.]MCI1787685.1 phenylalanine--tRNA ligase subunit beta [Actinomyces sp.]MCI1830407.1 phenylalanine--tRNA ligase subunit beta [Actinomyces sp.]